MFEAEIQQYDNTVHDYQRIIVEPMGAGAIPWLLYKAPE
jgi:hypothetical protein